MTDSAGKSRAPAAHVCHHSPGRLRIRVPSKRGDEGYFAFLTAALAGLKEFRDFRSNTISGSILFLADDIDEQAIAEFARSRGLFDLSSRERRRVPVSNDISAVMRGVSKRINRATGGELDLPTLVFLVLVFNGVVQIARGNFTAPPWYTAFWYALGIFSKSTEKGDSDSDDVIPAS